MSSFSLVQFYYNQWMMAKYTVLFQCTLSLSYTLPFYCVQTSWSQHHREKKTINRTTWLADESSLGRRERENPGFLSEVDREVSHMGEHTLLSFHF